MHAPPLLLLSTCGISLLTKSLAPDQFSWFVDRSNRTTLSDEDQTRLDAHVAERTAALAAADHAEQRRLCAELNGIYAVLDRWPADRVQHVMVHTDTLIGRAAAEAVMSVLAGSGHHVQPQTAPGLRTDDADALRASLSTLTRQLDDLLPGYRQAGHSIVFNLTGGFKSLNAYLQALGMIHADRCVFRFEGASSLVEIPRLPVRLAEAAEVRDHLSLFRRLAVDDTVSADEAAGVPETLLLRVGDEVTTSVWGDVVWSRVRRELLGERVLEPLSPRLRIEPSVTRTAADLPRARVQQVNEALDALWARLENERPMLKSNTFKSLVGNPVPGSTHELYLWSDEGAWRLFGHFEGPTFVADRIGPHL